MIFIPRKIFFTNSDSAGDGGTLTQDGGDNIHTFTSSGQFIV